MIPPDPEGIAFDERRQRLYWSSEGERITEDPNRTAAVGSVGSCRRARRRLRRRVHAAADAAHVDGSHGTPAEPGLEGLDPDAERAVPVGGDGGPRLQRRRTGRPTTAGALTRVTRFDVETRAATAQYAYPLDKVSSGPNGDNGLTDLVALDDENFLVRRALATAPTCQRHSTGPASPDADDVLVQALADRGAAADDDQDPARRPAEHRRPIWTMSRESRWDPSCPTARQSLLLVTDDNFSPQQMTQFVAFAVLISACSVARQRSQSRRSPSCRCRR